MRTIRSAALFGLPVLVLLAAAFMLRVAAVEPPDEPAEPELAAYMGTMQTYTHKLLLAAQAKNVPLVDFYVHELEALTEEIAHAVPTYEGYEIGTLMPAMMGPPLEAIEAQLNSDAPTRLGSHVSGLVMGCNSCHAATAHAFIVIPDEATTNPFLQDFAPPTSSSARQR